MDPLAIVRSDPFISAIFASRSSSPSALLFSAFNSLARSFIAAFSSAVNPFGCLVFVADNGPGWVAVLLESAEAVLGLRPGPISFDIGVAGPHPPGAEAAWEVRAFFGKDGSTVEDPVTGSLNASLAGWLIRSGRAEAHYVAAQGTALSRAGRVHLSQDAEGVIWVGGGTVTCMEGWVEL